jgi:hypothetical protein
MMRTDDHCNPLNVKLVTGLMIPSPVKGMIDDFQQAGKKWSEVGDSYSSVLFVSRSRQASAYCTVHENYCVAEEG